MDGSSLGVQPPRHAEDKDVLQEPLDEVLALVSHLLDVEASLFNKVSLLLQGFAEFCVRLEPANG